MKRCIIGVLAAVMLCALLFGCGPEKRGAGGRMQPYDPVTGSYKSGGCR